MCCHSSNGICYHSNNGITQLLCWVSWQNGVLMMSIWHQCNFLVVLVADVWHDRQWSMAYTVHYLHYFTPPLWGKIKIGIKKYMYFEYISFSIRKKIGQHVQRKTSKRLLKLINQHDHWLSKAIEILLSECNAKFLVWQLQHRIGLYL